MTDDPARQLLELLPTLVGFLGGFATAILAEPLRQRFFASKLRLAFSIDSDCISHTPATDGMHEIEVTYLRVRVENRSFRLAKACRVFLVNFEWVDDKGRATRTEWCDSIQLAWAVRDKEAYDAQDLAKGVPYFVDVLSFMDGTAIISPKVKALPLRYNPLFAQHGCYQLTLRASGDGVKPADLRLRLNWQGDRKALDAQVAYPSVDDVVRQFHHPLSTDSLPHTTRRKAPPTSPSSSDPAGP